MERAIRMTKRKDRKELKNKRQPCRLCHPERSEGSVDASKVVTRVLINRMLKIKKRMVNIHQYWIYIMSNNTRSVLYIGVTNDLYRRYVEHKKGIVEGFTKKYKCHSLLYYEEFAQVDEAIAREKELKGWTREKKERLIKQSNPYLKDLAEMLKWTYSDSSLRSE